jgi:hypothetical protein
MSNNNNLIDLTGDDDDEQPVEDAFDAGLDDFFFDEDFILDQPEHDIFHHDAPQPPPHMPPQQQPNPGQQTFIDLSDDDDITAEAMQAAPQDRTVRRESTGSDIVFVGERTIRPPANPPPNRRRSSVRDRRPTPGPQRNRRPRSLAAPPPLPGIRALPDLIRRTLFGAAEIAMMPDGHGGLPPPPPLHDELEIVEFNYGQVGLPTQDRASETPQTTPGEAYKEPEPVPEGFAGDIEEDGVYICPLCEEELATGESEDKQQVWVAKQCGHVSSIFYYLESSANGIGLLR